MDKVVLSFEQPDNAIAKHNNQKIEVKPIISFGDEIMLIGAYLDSYFAPTNKTFPQSEYDYLAAEYAFRLGVLGQCTNIDMEATDPNALIENIKLWQEVTDKIDNYPDVRIHLMDVVSEVKEQMALKQSIGSVIDELVEKALGVLETLSQTEINENTLKELKGLIGDLNNGMGKQPQLQDAMADVKKTSRRGRKPKGQKAE
jgi:hypothetical protein